MARRWLATVEPGTDERGVRRRKCVSCPSGGDAKRGEATLTGEVLSGTYVEPSTATVAEFVDEGRSHAGSGRAQSPKDHYEIANTTQLNPALRAPVREEPVDNSDNTVDSVKKEQGLVEVDGRHSSLCRAHHQCEVDGNGRLSNNQATL